MEYTITKQGDKNITFVFRAVDRSRVSLDKLKTLGEQRGGSTQVVELPGGGTIVVLNEEQLSIQLQGRRLVVIDHSTTTVEGTPLPEIAIGATKALGSRKQVAQMAYGLNFEILLSLNKVKDTRSYFRDQFVKDVSGWKSKLASELTGFEPRFFFTKGQTRYDLRLVTPTEEEEMQSWVRVIANAHFETSDRPTPAKLRANLTDEYEFLGEVLSSI